MNDPEISAAVGNALLNALALVTYAMDKADEDVIDTDAAVAWMETVASILDRCRGRAPQTSAGWLGRLSTELR